MGFKKTASLVLVLAMILSTLCAEEEETADDPESSQENGSDPSTYGQRRKQRNVLVFGGNGFLGADTVQLLIDNHDNVTMVNRGNWYWDSYHRIRPHVNHVSCDRKNDLDSCEDVVKIIADSQGFDAVIDFSAYGPKEPKEATALLKGKTQLYILISTDSVYDVSTRDHDELTKETDSVRPEDEEEREKLAYHHEYGSNKLKAEEELIQQRYNSDGAGIPYVVLRLPDVIGPRDTTFRWWLYQLWVKLSSHIAEPPLSIPPFLEDRNMSFVYSKDVAKLVFDLLARGDEMQDHVFNVAYPEPKTINDLVASIEKYLGAEPSDIKLESNQSKTLFLYPSVRRGPLDVSKIQNQLDWQPTAWDLAVKDTVEFFEDAMAGDDFNTQRDEIVQVLTSNLFRDNIDKVYDSLEHIYDIDLHHFRSREEL